MRVHLPEAVGVDTLANGGWHALAATAAAVYLDPLTREDHVAMAAKAHAAALEPAAARADVTGADLTAGEVAHTVEELRARLETVEPGIAEVDVFGAFARDLHVLYRALDRDTPVSRDELTAWSNPVGLAVAEALTDGEPDLDVLLAVAAIDDVDGISQRVDGLLDHVTSARDLSFDGSVRAALVVLDDDLSGLLDRIDTARRDERTVYLSAADVRTLIDAEALAADPTGWLSEAGVPAQRLEQEPAATQPEGALEVDGSDVPRDEPGQPQLRRSPTRTRWSRCSAPRTARRATRRSDPWTGRASRSGRSSWTRWTRRTGPRWSPATSRPRSCRHRASGHGPGTARRRSSG